MSSEDLGSVRVPADPLDATVDFLERLGFRLEEIAPADDPAEALMTGHGLHLTLDRAYRGEAELVLPSGGTLPPGRYVGPSGLLVEVAAPRALNASPPAPEFVHTRLAETPFHPGRAGLLYRDLLPSRLGGRWIASHIRAATGGPVDDQVHHHRVRLQLIYCLSGEAELVYQDQGAPFTFRAGRSRAPAPRPPPPGARRERGIRGRGARLACLAPDIDRSRPGRSPRQRVRQSASARVSGSCMPWRSSVLRSSLALRS